MFLSNQHTLVISSTHHSDHLQEDAAGGIVPQDLGVAKRVDLITLPFGVGGTNCGNCRFIRSEDSRHFCSHPKVHQYVNDRMCCAEWDNDEVVRPWDQ